MSGNDSQQGVHRRDVLAGLGAAATTSLAGCPAGGGSNDGSGGRSGDGNVELGERVPTIEMPYGANVKAFEVIQTVMGESIAELGVETNVEPVEITTLYQNIVTDQRNSQLPMYYNNPNPNRLDPHPHLIQYTADKAGAAPQTNWLQYADCDYSTLAYEQAKETDQEARREMVHEAFAKLNEEVAFIPSGSATLIQAVRTDMIDVQNVTEQRYLTATNPKSIVNSEAKTDDNRMLFQTGPSSLNTKNYPTSTTFSDMAIWNHLVHSPLIEYDENIEKFNLLADSIDYERDGTRIIVSLKDATFHNGDPVTAEDVKFTYDQVISQKGTYPTSPNVPLDTIEVLDDKTTQFDLTEVHVPFVEKDFPLWGIMHKQTWEDGGAVENPGEFDFEPTIGSGPYEVANFEQSRSMRLVPHDGHPRWEPNSEIVYKAFRDAQSAVQGVKAGEIYEANIGSNPSIASEFDGNDNVEILPMNTTGNLLDCCQMNIPPTKFKPFRQACARANNAPKILAVYSPEYGKTNPYGLPINTGHPWHPPEDMLTEVTPQDGPDVEGAEEILSEAGWGWDDNDNLHYPADADLSPLWPQGETPDPSEFPCLGEEGQYVPSGER